jgi:hypothetical protein
MQDYSLPLYARPVGTPDLPSRTSLEEREHIIKSYVQDHRMAKGGCQSGDLLWVNKDQNSYSLFNSRHIAAGIAIRIQLAFRKPNHFFDLRMRATAEEALYVVRPIQYFWKFSHVRTSNRESVAEKGHALIHSMSSKPPESQQPDGCRITLVM